MKLHSTQTLIKAASRLKSNIDTTALTSLTKAIEKELGLKLNFHFKEAGGDYISRSRLRDKDMGAFVWVAFEADVVVAAYPKHNDENILDVEVLLEFKKNNGQREALKVGNYFFDINREALKQRR